MPSGDNAVIQRRLLLAHSRKHDGGTKRDTWGPVNPLQVAPCALSAILPSPKTESGTELLPSTVVLIFSCISKSSGKFFFLASPRDMWDLSSWTRVQTCAPCTGSTES